MGPSFTSVAKILGKLSQHTHSALISFDMLGASSIIQAYQRYTTENDFPQTNAPTRPTINRPFQGLTVCCTMVLRPFWKTLSLYKANHLQSTKVSAIHNTHTAGPTRGTLSASGLLEPARHGNNYYIFKDHNSYK